MFTEVTALFGEMQAQMTVRLLRLQASGGPPQRCLSGRLIYTASAQTVMIVASCCLHLGIA